MAPLSALGAQASRQLKQDPDEDLPDQYLQDGLKLVNMLGELFESAPPGRDLGTVEKFAEKRGFGLIVPKDGGDKVFAHYTQIHSSDKWPRLVSGMRVEYEPKWDKGKMIAVNVTAPGGSEINIEEEEAVDRVLRMSLDTFAGSVTWWHHAGYGFITTDTAIDWPDDLPAGYQLYVARQDLVLEEGSASRLDKGMRVQFRVHKPEDKPCAAVEVTAIGGKPLKPDGPHWQWGGGTKRALEPDWEGSSANAEGEEATFVPGTLLVPKVRRIIAEGEEPWQPQLSPAAWSSIFHPGIGEGAGSSTSAPWMYQAEAELAVHREEEVPPEQAIRSEAIKHKIRCMFFANGRCNKGEACLFSHNMEDEGPAPTALKLEPCKFWARGRCMRGSSCAYVHTEPEQEQLLSFS